jgi:hypothetical protein
VNSTDFKQRFAVLLAGSGQDGALDSLAELDMPSDADQISRDESEALEAESRDARALDRRLASDLGRGQPEGPTSSAVQLRALGGRPRLPAGTERRLVQAAKDGDRRPL